MDGHIAALTDFCTFGGFAVVSLIWSLTMYETSEEEQRKSREAGRILGWVAYVAVAVVCVFVSLVVVGPWFGFALALAFVFGPKLWKRL